MEKLKKWVMSISLVSLMIVVYSCSSDDSFIDEMETYEIASRSVTPSLDTILNSPEFQNLDKTYTELISIIRNSVENLTQDEIDEFSELHLLYKSDSLKYESLYKHFICNTLYEDNYTKVEQTCKSFTAAREKLLSNREYETYLKKNGEFITSILMQHAGQVKLPEFTVKNIKTRSEEDIQECLDLCREDFERAVAIATAVLACHTAVSVLSCVLSSGASFPAELIKELGVIALYELAIIDADNKYKICKERCYLE